LILHSPFIGAYSVSVDSDPSSLVNWRCSYPFPSVVTAYYLVLLDSPADHIYPVLLEAS
jgi:hypothetical protein